MKTTKIKEKTWLEVSKHAIAKNTEVIKNLVKVKTILAPVIKANAYGHGLTGAAKILLQSGADWLCVNSAEEASALRQDKIKCPLLIIGPTMASDADKIIKTGARVFVYDYNLLRTLGRQAISKNKIIPVHIKVDTGMSRQGIPPSNLKKFILAALEIRGIKIEGIATHFATSDEIKNKKHFLQQLAVFQLAAQQAETILGRKLIKHCANSAAAMLYPQAHFDLIRPGIAVYGCYPSKEIKTVWEKNHQPLQPALTVKTKIAAIKKLPANTGVGYGCTYHTRRPTTIAILPLGYYDGLNRLLSNRAVILINGQKAPVIGQISMDITIVDISKIKTAKVGDEAVIIGKQGSKNITAEELALATQTINYEILTGWKSELKRYYF